MGRLAPGQPTLSPEGATAKLEGASRHIRLPPARVSTQGDGVSAAAAASVAEAAKLEGASRQLRLTHVRPLPLLSGQRRLGGERLLPCMPHMLPLSYISVTCPLHTASRGERRWRSS